MRSPRSRIGLKGEIAAASYLGQNDYMIIDSNYHTRYGEIDLIARDGDYIVFVEVRSLNNTSFCTPIETISQSKLNKIIHCAQEYLTEKKLTDRPVRFDIVEVIHIKNSSPQITLIKNAFDVQQY